MDSKVRSEVEGLGRVTVAVAGRGLATSGSAAGELLGLLVPLPLPSAPVMGGRYVRPSKSRRKTGDCHVYYPVLPYTTTASRMPVVAMPDEVLVFSTG